MKPFLFILALLLSGCAPAVRPGAPLMEKVSLQKSLTNSNPALGKNKEAELPEKWWRAFHDEKLDSLVALALTGNPALEEAGDRLHEAQAAVIVSGASLDPHIDSIGKFTRQRLSRNGNHVIYNGKTSTIADIFPLAVNYNLDLWGRNEEILFASRASEEAAAAKYRLGALMLSSAVIKTYFALNAARKLAEDQEKIVHLTEEKARLLDAAYRAGIKPKTPSVSSNAALGESRAVLEAISKRRESLNFALHELMGRMPDDETRTSSSSVPENFDIPQRIDLDVVSKRPDIQVALWNVRKQSHLEKVARDAFYPNVNLFALAGFNSIGLSDLLGPGGATYAYGPAIDLPIFEGGTLQGRLHEREAAYDEAVHAYNRVLLAAIRQIADALSAMRYERMRLDERTHVLELRQSEAGIAGAGFRSGISGRLSCLEAEIRLNREKMNTMEETLNWLYSITDAATALGGGFGNWPS